MGRVYNNEWELPDDPNRVGDEDLELELEGDDPDEGEYYVRNNN